MQLWERWAAAFPFEWLKQSIKDVSWFKAMRERETKKKRGNLRAQTSWFFFALSKFYLE
mgnify:CR=1 FL=1